MKLETRQFGRLAYESHEMIRLVGLGADPDAISSWLLLADKHHPHLFWLQSTTDTDCAIPVCSLSGTLPAASLRPSPRHESLVKNRPGSRTTRACIALAEIREESGEVFLNLERPILIDPHSHRGIQLQADDDQALQYAPSAKVAPLRKCA